MDGLTLPAPAGSATPCPPYHADQLLKNLITSKQAMGAGVVDYLVKGGPDPENLQNRPLPRPPKGKKGALCWASVSTGKSCRGVRSYQERFFVRLYAGLFPDEAALEQPLQHMELNLASDAYLVASLRDHRQHRPYPRPAAEAEFFLRADAGEPPCKTTCPAM